ncbi:MAG TPA: DUF262 domain-containing protein, partial [Clostridia bacterium]|nr:DUF262 domain-containing protein [Clostridia bacterium]
LIEFTPTFLDGISKEIINQYWFPLDWKKDPTISSMLVVLDSIHDKFRDVDNIWGKLKEKTITFYFLAIRDMGLTDELYIKMNSRGKPLTQFEHFKAELERKFSLVDKEISQRILSKIDREWTELLWQYRDGDNVMDDEFLRYFKFICDIICYKNGDSPQGKSSDEFDLLNEYFSGNKDDIIRNIGIFEDYFDCWCSLDNEAPGEFLKRFISHEHTAGKIKIDNRDEIDIFKDCLKKHSTISGRRRAFPLNRIVQLYGIICYLLNRSEISEAQFARRLRIINNLVMNSEDEISDSESRSSGNRMPAILKQVDYIMKTGLIDTGIENNFSAIQLTEELEKIEWLEDNPDRANQLFALEDHGLLQGQIGILGLENFEYFERFKDLFECDRDKVDCALMAIDFYGQQEQNGWRYQLGCSAIDSAWRGLFHKSRNRGFERTKKTLIKLLSIQEEVNDGLLDRVIAEYIDYCEGNSVYTWRYYYIKYPVFRPRRYGKYFNEDPDKNPYMFGVMATQSKLSSNSYMPFLKEADPKNISKDDYGRRLIHGDSYIEPLADGFIIKSIEDDSLISKITISQNEDGIDTENRIEKLKAHLVPGGIFRLTSEDNIS